jgi:hypothetical protein
MASFIDHLAAEILALEQALEADPRYIKLRELRRVQDLYEADSHSVLTTDSAPTPVPGLRRRMATREMSPETKLVIEEAERFLAGRTEPVPLQNLYHELVEVRGCRIGGENPVNGLSSILSRSKQFVPHGRAGWTLGLSDGTVHIGTSATTKYNQDSTATQQPRQSGMGGSFVRSESNAAIWTNAAARYLRTKGSRAQTTEIFDALVKEGVMTNDKVSRHNLGAYLSRYKDRFYNVKGQGYGLREWSQTSSKTETPNSGTLFGAPRANGAEPLNP